MPKVDREFPINVVFRVSIPQEAYLRDAADLHGVTVSEFLRTLVENARVNHVVDQAIATLDRIAGPVQ